MVKQSISFFIPDNIDAPLWRYMPEEYFRSLLEESALYFCRADLFIDPLEGTQSRPTIANRPLFYSGATDHWINETVPMFDERTRKCLYVNCWHNNNKESKHMWDKYSGMIVIKSTLNRIKQSTQDTEREFLISPVRYINHDRDYTSDANSFCPFFCKDESYSNEREVRFALIENFIHIGDENFDTLPFEKGIFVPVDYSILIEKAIIYPTAQNEEY